MLRYREKQHNKSLGKRKRRDNNNRRKQRRWRQWESFKDSNSPKLKAEVAVVQYCCCLVVRNLPLRQLCCFLIFRILPNFLCWSWEKKNWKFANERKIWKNMKVRTENEKQKNAVTFVCGWIWFWKTQNSLFVAVENWEKLDFFVLRLFRPTARI